MILANLGPRREFKVGDEAFLPFWIVLEFLDATPPAPFIRCRVLGIGTRELIGLGGKYSFEACDLNLGKPDLIAPGVPATYLIHRDDLREWANRIGNWFIDYQATEGEAQSNGGRNAGTE